MRGVIGFEHAAVLARAHAPTVMTAFAEAEGELVAAAREMDFDEFCVVVDRWLDFVLPERAEKRAREQEERRAASASRTSEGMVRVDAWLDAIGGTEFLAELRVGDGHYLELGVGHRRAEAHRDHRLAGVVVAHLGGCEDLDGPGRRLITGRVGQRPPLRPGRCRRCGGPEQADLAVTPVA